MNDDYVVEKLILDLHFKEEKDNNNHFNIDYYLFNGTGVWKKYNRSDYKLLNSLKKSNTLDSAAFVRLIKKTFPMGNIYLFYAKGKNGECNFPKIFIKTTSDDIIEAIGFSLTDLDELEFSLSIVAADKIAMFPNSFYCLDCISDMFSIYEIERKIKNNSPFTENDIRFLHDDGSDRPIVLDRQRPKINIIMDEKNFDIDLSYVDGQPIYECVSKTEDKSSGVVHRFVKRLQRDKR